MTSITSTALAITGRLFKKFLGDKIFWYDKKCSNVIEISIGDEIMTIDSMDKIAEIPDDADILITSGEACSDTDIFGHDLGPAMSIQTLFDQWFAIEPRADVRGRYGVDMWLNVDDAELLYIAACQDPGSRPEGLLEADGSIDVVACLHALLYTFPIPGATVDFMTGAKEDNSAVFPLLATA
jgi:hypothetical protein